MKKFLPYILILIVLIEIFSLVPIASASPTNPNEACAGVDNPTTQQDANFPCVKPYVLLAPLPCEAGKDGCSPDGKLEKFNPGEGLGTYLNLMIKLFIGICAVLSVVMIVMGGVEYMTSELAHTKEAGKEKITHAVLGLIIALGAYALLFTINPDLLKSDFNTPTVSDATGTCSIPEFKTQEECAGKGAWMPYLGRCTFRGLRDGFVKSAEKTTRENCELHGDKFIGWVRTD